MEDLAQKKILSNLSDRNYVLVSTGVVGSRRRVHYVCDQGHAHDMDASNLLQGRGCPSCANAHRNDSKKIPLTTIRDGLAVEGYQLVSETYKSNRTPLDCICPNGHSWRVRWYNWCNGKRCSACERVHGLHLDRDEALAPIHEAKYQILGGLDEYVDVRSYVTVKCPMPGHNSYRVQVYNFRNGRRCPGCACRSSAGERELFSYFLGLAPDAVSSPRILDGKELDAYSPSLALGVEFNGLYWHSVKAGKSPSYHLDKLESAEAKGIRLLQFYEDEWRDKRGIVEAIIAQAVGTSLTRVGARKCQLLSVSRQDRKPFLDANHLQGDTGAAAAFGLYLDGILLEVLSVRKRGYTRGRDQYEIARLASARGVVVVGGLSRLAKVALTWVKERGGKRLETYADRRYSSGRSYAAAGFVAAGHTAPGFWYTDFSRRVHRYGLRKTSECPPGTTADAWRATQGWHKIYDCGQLRFYLE